MSAGPVHVALTFDRLFWPPAYASVRSACLASRHRSELVFHLFYRDLGPDAIEAFEALGRDFGARIVLHDLDESAFDAVLVGKPTDPRMSAMVYARLILGSLLGPEVRRVIYLDADTLVLAPLETLNRMDLEGQPLGAVRDAHAWRVANRRDVAHNHDIFDPSQPYFNAGVLLIDLDAWRNEDLVGQVDAIARRHDLASIHYDQGALNIIFRDRVCWLPRPWNLTNPQRAHEISDEAIFHYTGARKPWQIFSGSGHARLYRHVMTNALFWHYWRMRQVLGFKRWFKGLRPGARP